ncbi:hypothetical protein Rhal01_00504 [Rubritalea halochordaticola]|uniref:Uncharacterized protein n=1 Tax=Rubritalea halochordaticola TaxID=714537 RepID=A0ABP9UYB6_9BACT
MFLRTLLSAVFLSTLTALCADEVIRVPNPNAEAINQVGINKKGCGPVSQLNSYAFSSEKWRAVTDKIPGDTEGKRFVYLVKKHGMKFSRHMHGRLRWDYKSGMSSLDLLDYMNDFHAQARLPKIDLETLFIEDKESHEDLLQRTHKHLKKSLNKGFPPIMDLRRFAKIRQKAGYHWRSVHGHFVVVYEIPAQLPQNAQSMTIKYIDPWGGKIRTGTLRIPSGDFFANNNNDRADYKLRKTPCLEADFPGCQVGLQNLKSGEENVLILSATLGDF